MKVRYERRAGVRDGERNIILNRRGDCSVTNFSYETPVEVSDGGWDLGFFLRSGILE